MDFGYDVIFWKKWKKRLTFVICWVYINKAVAIDNYKNFKRSSKSLFRKSENGLKKLKKLLTNETASDNIKKLPVMKKHKQH